MARRADIFFQPESRHRPGVALRNDAATCSITTWRRWNSSIKWVNGFDEYRKSLEPFTLEFAEQITGVPAETLEDGRARNRRR